MELPTWLALMVDYFIGQPIWAFWVSTRTEVRPCGREFMRGFLFPVVAAVLLVRLL